MDSLRTEEGMKDDNQRLTPEEMNRRLVGISPGKETGTN